MESKKFQASNMIMIEIRNTLMKVLNQLWLNKYNCKYSI